MNWRRAVVLVLLAAPGCGARAPRRGVELALTSGEGTSFVGRRAALAPGESLVAGRPGVRLPGVPPAARLWARATRSGAEADRDGLLLAVAVRDGGSGRTIGWAVGEGASEGAVVRLELPGGGRLEAVARWVEDGAGTEPERGEKAPGVTLGYAVHRVEGTVGASIGRGVLADIQPTGAALVLESPPGAGGGAEVRIEVLPLWRERSGCALVIRLHGAAGSGFERLFELGWDDGLLLAPMRSQHGHIEVALDPER